MFNKCSINVQKNNDEKDVQKMFKKKSSKKVLTLQIIYKKSFPLYKLDILKHYSIR